MDTFSKRTIIKVKNEKTAIVEEPIITEYPLTLYLNGVKEKTFFMTPKNLEELIVGYLRVGDKICGRQDILRLEIFEEKNQAFVEVGDGISIEEARVQEIGRLEIENIYAIMNKTLEPTKLFVETGGIHSAAIYQAEKEVIKMYDVARHNAVDKAIGYCLMNAIDCYDKILVISGRITFEMILKAEKAGIPMVLSKSAPTTLSVSQADQAGITLIGFIRGQQMNVYTHPNRINLSDETFQLLTKNKRIRTLKNTLYLKAFNK